MTTMTNEDVLEMCSYAALRDRKTVLHLVRAQQEVGTAWNRADDADEDDERKDKIARALRAVDSALRAYGLPVPK